LRNGGDGFFYDDRNGRLYVQIVASADSGYRVVIENIILGASNDKEGLVTDFRLEQNYPNPFNATTVIRYEVRGIRSQGLGVSGQQSAVSGQRSAVGEVNLLVYDVLGREVATLVRGALESGSYSVLFDVDRAAPLPLASGFISTNLKLVGMFNGGRWCY